MTRLVFFIHTHKCAGTSLLHLFAQHEFVRMCPDGLAHGGMPKYLRDLKNVESEAFFSEHYDRQRIEAFVEETLREGINFVATEWVVPNLDDLPRRDDVFYFTILRDPYARYLSNYHFDLQRGYSRAPDVWKYRNRSMFRQYDYYTRLFSSRLVLDDSEVTEEDFERAVAMLRRMDAVLILEEPETFQLLSPLGLDLSKLERRNAGKRTKEEPPAEFREFFMKQAERDYRLYDEGRRLASEALTTRTSRGSDLQLVAAAMSRGQKAMVSAPPAAPPAGPRPARPPSDACLEALEALYRSPGEQLHTAIRSAGFTLPAREGLRTYDLDDPEHRRQAAETHGFCLTVDDGRNNVLAVHEDLRAPQLTLAFRASNALCILGRNAVVAGSLDLGVESVAVVAGSEQRLSIELDVSFRSRGQRFFWGRGSIARGVRCRLSGDGVSVVVGDEGSFAQDVSLRPADAHTIYDLTDSSALNPPRDIVVEPHVWMSREVLVLGGAHVGAGSVLGARAVVPAGVYSPFSIYSGNPARLVRQDVSWDGERDVSRAACERARAVQQRYGEEASASRCAQPGNQQGFVERVRSAIDGFRRTRTRLEGRRAQDFLAGLRGWSRRLRGRSSRP